MYCTGWRKRNSTIFCGRIKCSSNLNFHPETQRKEYWIFSKGFSRISTEPFEQIYLQLFLKTFHLKNTFFDISTKLEMGIPNHLRLSLYTDRVNVINPKYYITQK